MLPEIALIGPWIIQCRTPPPPRLPPSKRTRGAIDESGWIFNSAEFLGQAESLDDKLREIKQRTAKGGKGGYAARGSANTQRRVQNQAEADRAAGDGSGRTFWLRLSDCACLKVKHACLGRTDRLCLTLSGSLLTSICNLSPSKTCRFFFFGPLVPSMVRSVSKRCYTVLQVSGNGAEVPQIQIWSDVGPRSPDADPVDRRSVH